MVLIIPDHAQGAAIGDGGLWIARIDWNWGTLDRLDPVTGAPQRRYEIAPGTESIAFGNAGRLWAVSEAGSRYIYDHPFLGLFQPFFPLVFSLDLSRLECVGLLLLNWDAGLPALGLDWQAPLRPGTVIGVLGGLSPRGDSESATRNLGMSAQTR
jgi:hypothetical protein